MLERSELKDAAWIISLLIFSRLVPHWPNMTALGSVAILVPMWLGKHRFASILPLVALLVSDMIIGFHSTMIYTYLSVFLVSLISWKLSTHHFLSTRFLSIFSWATTSALLFFIITNFGAWLALDMYTKNISGLLLSYRNGLPFLGYEIFGNLIYLTLAITVRQYWMQTTHISKSLS